MLTWAFLSAAICTMEEQNGSASNSPRLNRTCASYPTPGACPTTACTSRTSTRTSCAAGSSC